MDAPIIDGFRSPENRYSSGNRGLEYDIESGTAVSAVDDGRVTFVGRIGAARHVVVDHGEGLKSTYAFVESSTVVRGQRVKRGQQVATAGPGFHLTARLWGEYVDPMLLFGGAEIVVNLADGAVVGARGDTPKKQVMHAPTVKNWHPFAGIIAT